MSARRLRVLGLAGSLRRRSYNRALLLAARDLAPAGVEVCLDADLRSIPMFDEDLEAETAGGPVAVRVLRDAAAAADGILVATPEYNQSIPGVLKNAIDWLSRAAPGEVLGGKPVAIVGATSGRWGTRLAQSALRQTLFATGALVLPGPSLNAARAHDLFDADGRLADASTRRELAEVLSAFAAWIARLEPAGRLPG